MLSWSLWSQQPAHRLAAGASSPYRNPARHQCCCECKSSKITAGRTHCIKLFQKARIKQEKKIREWTDENNYKTISETGFGWLKRKQDKVQEGKSRDSPRVSAILITRREMSQGINMLNLITVWSQDEVGKQALSFCGRCKLWQQKDNSSKWCTLTFACSGGVQ